MIVPNPFPYKKTQWHDDVMLRAVCSHHGLGILSECTDISSSFLLRDVATATVLNGKTVNISALGTRHAYCLSI